MKNLYFYKIKNIGSNYYCKWIFDLDEIMKIDNKNLLCYQDKNFKRDLTLTKKYHRFLLNFLYKKLNKKLDITYSKRQWEILIGRWVKFYVDAIYFRYNYITKNIKETKIKKFYFKFNSKNHYIPHTTSDYVEITDHKEGNNFYNWKILKYLEKNHPKKKIKIFKKSSNKKINLNRLIQFYNLTGIKNNMINFVNIFLKLFLKNKSPIIVSSYLPFTVEIILKIKNRSLFFWNYFFYKKYYDLHSIFKNKKIKRDNIFNVKKFKGFQGLLLLLLDDCLPSCFLENFHQIDSFTTKNMVIKKPRFIFTSNEFLYNEFFKSYVAKTITDKTKYIVGQHGSAYGSINDQLDTVEELTSDYFLTWGWGKNKNHKPIGIFNQLGKTKFIKKKKINDLLLVTTNYPHKRNFWDKNEEYMNNFKEQIAFLKSLDFSLFEKVIIRLHHTDKKYFNFLKLEYQKIHSKISIDEGKKRMEDYFKNNTLIVFSYLSSGFFEFFSRNLNCLCFDSLHKNQYQPKFYNRLYELKKNNFFFDNGKSTSRYINLLLKENNSKLSMHTMNSANSEFIKYYANTDNVSLKKINDILNK